MKKYDCLKLNISIFSLSLYSTNPIELENLMNQISMGIPNYFSYIKDWKKGFNIRGKQKSMKGHEIMFLFDKASENWEDLNNSTKISVADLKYYALTIIISNGWQLNSGNDDFSTFIKFSE